MFIQVTHFKEVDPAKSVEIHEVNPNHTFIEIDPVENKIFYFNKENEIKEIILKNESRYVVRSIPLD